MSKKITISDKAYEIISAVVMQMKTQIDCIEITESKLIERFVFDCGMYWFSKWLTKLHSVDSFEEIKEAWERQETLQAKTYKLENGETIDVFERVVPFIVFKEDYDLFQLLHAKFKELELADELVTQDEKTLFSFIIRVFNHKYGDGQSPSTSNTTPQIKH